MQLLLYLLAVCTGVKMFQVCYIASGKATFVLMFNHHESLSFIYKFLGQYRDSQICDHLKWIHTISNTFEIIPGTRW